MKKGVMVRALLAAFFVSYPFLVYFGIQFLPPSFFALVLIVLLAMRLGVLLPEERRVFVPMLLVFLVYAAATAISDNATMLLFYPALVNFSMCVVFLNSLRGEVVSIIPNQRNTTLAQIYGATRKIDFLYVVERI